MRESIHNKSKRSKEFVEKAQELARLLDSASQIYFPETGWIGSKWIEVDPQDSPTGWLGFYSSTSGDTRIYHYEQEKILQRLSTPSPSPEEILKLLKIDRREDIPPYKVMIPLLLPETWSAFFVRQPC